MISPNKNVNLYVMIGPAGAGKSSFLDSIVYRYKGQGRYLLHKIYPSMIISSDNLRQDFCGDFKNQAKNNQVFAAYWDLAETRLKHGLDTILDATNLTESSRKQAVELGTKYNANIHYVVINRPLADKIHTGGWRLNVIIEDKNLIEVHDKIFNDNLINILNTDGFSNVELHDFRILDQE